MADETIKIELTPYTALSILYFSKEYLDSLIECEQTQSIRNSINEFESQIFKKISESQINESLDQIKIDEAFGFVPNREKDGQ